MSEQVKLCGNCAKRCDPTSKCFWLCNEICSGCEEWAEEIPRYTVEEIEAYLHYHHVSHERPATMINNPIKGIAAVTKRNREAGKVMAYTANVTGERPETRSERTT